MQASRSEWMDHAPRLALVVPCFCEEDVLPETMRRLVEVVNDLVARELVRPDSFALYGMTAARTPPGHSSRRRSGRTRRWAE